MKKDLLINLIRLGEERREVGNKECLNVAYDWCSKMWHISFIYDIDGDMMFNATWRRTNDMQGQILHIIHFILASSKVAREIRGRVGRSYKLNVYQFINKIYLCSAFFLWFYDNLKFEIASTQLNFEVRVFRRFLLDLCKNTFTCERRCWRVCRVTRSSAGQQMSRINRKKIIVKDWNYTNNKRRNTL